MTTSYQNYLSSVTKNSVEFLMGVLNYSILRRFRFVASSQSANFERIEISIES